MLGSVAIFVWGKRRFSWCLFAQEFFADLIDIAGAMVIRRSPGWQFSRR